MVCYVSVCRFHHSLLLLSCLWCHVSSSICVYLLVHLPHRFFCLCGFFVAFLSPCVLSVSRLLQFCAAGGKVRLSACLSVMFVSFTGSYLSCLCRLLSMCVLFCLSLCLLLYLLCVCMSPAICFLHHLSLSLRVCLFFCRFSSAYVCLPVCCMHALFCRCCDLCVRGLSSIPVLVGRLLFSAGLSASLSRWCNCCSICRASFLCVATSCCLCVCRFSCVSCALPCWPISLLVVYFLFIYASSPQVDFCCICLSASEHSTCLLMWESWSLPACICL